MGFTIQSVGLERIHNQLDRSIWNDIHKFIKAYCCTTGTFSIINGVANIGDPASLGRMGGKTLLAYLLTTVLAVTLGLLLVNLVKPGKLVDENTRIDNRIGYEIWASSQNLQIKDGIHYLQDPEFMDRAKRITDLSKQELNDAAVNDKMNSANQAEESGPLQPLVDMIPDNFFEP